MKYTWRDFIADTVFVLMIFAVIPFALISQSRVVFKQAQKNNSLKCPIHDR